MKKIFVVIALCLICAISFTSCNQIKVKDGKGNNVSVIVDNQLINRTAFSYKTEINSAVNQLQEECKYPYTFVPTKIKICRVPGQFTNNIKIEVIGYAKNGFGVENEVVGIYFFPIK